MVSQSVSLGVEPYLGLMTRYLLLFDSYDLVFVGRPLWWEDRSVFCIFCWLSRAQYFSSHESLGTRDHILLPQVWDFRFHRLLQLAGSRWRYSTLPPHGSQIPSCSRVLLYALYTDCIENPASNSSSIVACICCLAMTLVMLRVYTAICLAAGVFSEPFPSNGRFLGSTIHAFNKYATIQYKSLCV
jgi:hypothetical protein